MATVVEAIASRLEAVAIRLEAIATGLELGTVVQMASPTEAEEHAGTKGEKQTASLLVTIIAKQAG